MKLYLHYYYNLKSLRKNTTVFSYVSDNESDPFSQVGSLWSFNYFFFNAQKMKICFFTCVAKRYIYLFCLVLSTNHDALNIMRLSCITQRKQFLKGRLASVICTVSKLCCWTDKTYCMAYWVMVFDQHRKTFFEII